MTDITYISKDQNWQDETTIYWFEVANCPELPTYAETIGVVEGRNPGLVWDDGEPIAQGATLDYLQRHLELPTKCAPNNTLPRFTGATTTLPGEMP